MEPIITLLIIGAIGGLVRSILGYETQSDDGEKFDFTKTLKSIIRASLTGTILVMGTISFTNTEITQATYVLAFVTAVGSDVLGKEGYSTIKEKVSK